MSITTADIQNFRKTVWQHYEAHGRELPWRDAEADGSFDPYKILVSELMLQQTQVARVVPKFETFIAALPDFESAADAPLSKLLTLWCGLGYNRRARYLHLSARLVTDKYGGRLPETTARLAALPGIGVNTAGAIQAYAFNKPALFVETNIRTVLIHHFFSREPLVADTALREVLDVVLDRRNPREYYWALMDYGSFLKTTAGNAGRRSASYRRQPAFAGSGRQIRGRVIRLLVRRTYTAEELSRLIDDPRLEEVLAALVKENLIVQEDGGNRLA